MSYGLRQLEVLLQGDCSLYMCMSMYPMSLKQITAEQTMTSTVEPVLKTALLDTSVISLLYPEQVITFWW